MLVTYDHFPLEEKAAFNRTCSNLGLNARDFDLEAEIECQDAVNWRSQAHVVVVIHKPTARARICTGYSRQSWIDAFDEQVRKYRFTKSSA